jgi:26S proteasome regulatory subunit N9
VDGVEFLLMKTLSLHLIEGIIDQVEGTVQVGFTPTLASHPDPLIQDFELYTP